VFRGLYSSTKIKFRILEGLEFMSLRTPCTSIRKQRNPEEPLREGGIVGSVIEKRERISLVSCRPLGAHYMEDLFVTQDRHVMSYGVRRARRHPMVSYRPAIEIRCTTMGREDRFGLRMMSAVDPLKLGASNVEILCHMKTVTLIIIGGIVSAHEKRDSAMDRAARVTYGIDSTGNFQWNFDRKRTQPLRPYV